MSMSGHVLPMADTGRVVVQRGPIWASRDELTLKIEAPSTCDLARTAARITTALYALIGSEGRSTEPVTFRVRALLGTANPVKGITEVWHRPGFDVDEEALPVGVHIMSLAAFDLLR